MILVVRKELLQNDYKKGGEMSPMIANEIVPIQSKDSIEILEVISDFMFFILKPEALAQIPEFWWDCAKDGRCEIDVDKSRVNKNGFLTVVYQTLP